MKTYYPLIMILLSFCLSCGYHTIEPEPPNEWRFVWQGNISSVQSINQIEIWDQYIFAIEGNNRIAVYDITLPHSPTFVTDIRLPITGRINRIALDWRGNIYVATGSSGLFVLYFRGNSIVFNPGYSHINAIDLSLEDDTLAVLTPRGWSIYSLIGGFDINEIMTFNYLTVFHPQRILFYGNWLYIFQGNRTMEVWDVNSSFNPTQPVWSYTLNGNIIDFCLINDYLSIAVSNGRDHFIYLFDIQMPQFMSAPIITHTSLLPSSINSSKNSIFISFVNNTIIWVYDFNDKFPRYRQYGNFSSQIKDIEISNDYVFIASLNRIDVYFFNPVPINISL